MQVVQEAPQAFISQLIPGETERQKNNVANQNSAFGTAQRGGGFPIPGNIQGIVEDVPAQERVRLDGL